MTFTDTTSLINPVWVPNTAYQPSVFRADLKGRALLLGTAVRDAHRTAVSDELVARYVALVSSCI